MSRQDWDKIGVRLYCNKHKIYFDNVCHECYSELEQENKQLQIESEGYQSGLKSALLIVEQLQEEIKKLKKALELNCICLKCYNEVYYGVCTECGWDEEKKIYHKRIDK